MSKKTYSNFNLFIRSTLFFICSTTAIVVFSTLVFLSGILPLRYRHAIARMCLQIILGMLKFFCHVDYKIEGLEHIPKGQTGIIMSKHQSTFETFLLPLVFHAPAIILKKELLWLPFFGWAVSVMGPIAIVRKKKNSAMQQVISQGTQALEEGRWILIFPEGTRVAYGTKGHYKLGGARLSAASGYPILPIAHDAGRYWPRRKFIKQPGTVHVVIGPLIDSKNRTPEELLTLTQDWIESTMTRIDGFVDKPAS